MRILVDFRRWARVAVLAACGLGSSTLLAEDITQPLTARAPRRPVMQAAAVLSGDTASAEEDSEVSPTGIQQVGHRRRCRQDESCPDWMTYDGWQEDPFNENLPEEAEEACEEDGPWVLTSIFADDCGTNWFTDNGWNMGGNVVQSYTTNFSHPADRSNFGILTDRSDDYQLNQLWYFIERQTEATDERPIDLGGRVTLLYGTNYRFTTAAGLEDNINRGHSFYGLAIPDAYGEVAYKRTKVKVGHFVSPVGYFTVDSAANFFSTYPWTYQFGEPFTHTGIWQTTTVTDNLSFGNGITRGWDSWDRSNPLTSPNPGFFNTFTYTGKDKGTFTYFGHVSNELNQLGTYSRRFIMSLVYSRQLTERLLYVYQTDIGQQQRALLTTGGSAQWYGVNQHLYYTLTDTLTLGTRFEWFRDDDGYRVAGYVPQNFPSPARSWPANRFGYQGSFYGWTLGSKWQFHKNAALRPNLRLDWYDGENNNPGGLKPFGDGIKNTQQTYSTDLVITF